MHKSNLCLHDTTTSICFPQCSLLWHDNTHLQRTVLPSMDSHLPATGPLHPYPEFPNAQYTRSQTPSFTHPSHNRILAYTSHALVLCNIYGMILSSGVWFEYYFTSLRPSNSLIATSAIFGAQFASLGIAVGPTAWVHRRWPRGWRVLMSVGAACVCGAWTALFFANKFWVILLCHGVLTGLGLGTLATVSLLVLSTHYKHDITIVSSMCGTAGYAGTVVYTGLTWICLRGDWVRMAHGISLAILLSTLLLAMFLARPHSGQNPTTSSPRHTATTSQSRSKQARWTTLLTALLLTLTLVPTILPPLLFPLLLTRAPTPHRADPGFYTLLALLSGATLSSILFPRISPSRLSPTALLSASCLLAGSALAPVIWTQTLYVGVACAVVFGVGLGGVGTLWVKGLRCLIGHGEGLRGVICVLMAFGGVVAGGGLVGSAAVLQSFECGVQVVLGAVTGCLVLGGAGIWVGVGISYFILRKGRGVS